MAMVVVSRWQNTWHYKFSVASRGALLVAVNVLLAERFPRSRLRTMNRAARLSLSLFPSRVVETAEMLIEII